MGNDTLLLVLMLPVVATIVGIAKHVIGVKSLNVYAPIILTYAFYALGVTHSDMRNSDVWLGIRYGLVILAVVILSTAITSTLVKRFRMHYFPKVSLNLSVVALVVVVVFSLAASTGRAGITAVDTLAVVLICSISEQFSSIMFKKKFRTALLLSIETCVTAICCYLLISWHSFQELVLAYPFVIVFCLVANYLIGKYQGLRFREYFRFAEILDQEEE